jgi:hypothetical protein
VDKSPILLLVTDDDVSYLPAFKPLLKGRAAFVINVNPDSAGEIELYARSKGIKYIISTNPVVLRQVVSDQSGSEESLDNWAGSLWERNGITFLFLNPLRQLYSVAYGKFIAQRFVSKITEPENWRKTPPFSWEPARLDTIQRWFELFSKTIVIASDIETRSWDDNPENTLEGERHTTIRSIAYTGLWENGDIHTIVLPIHDAPIEELPLWLSWMRRFNSLPQSKVFQNGLYDCWHMVQYHAPVIRYLWDTQSLFHSWYAEFPKDLAFITAYLIHNTFYWKDMAKAASQMLQWEYNARDGWATMVSLLALLEVLPDWAIKNHLIKFPLWVPCLDCNLEGFLCENNQRAILVAQDKQHLLDCERRLQHWFGAGFNPRSPQQVGKLIAFYGSPDITSTGEVELIKFGFRHPLNKIFADTILKSREISKRISAYYKPADFSVSKSKSKKKQSPLLKKGRIFYGLNPDGTDTSRMSCKEGPSWTGMQIMNQPREPTGPKSMEVADPGWRIFELDNEKSESYTTAYKSGSLSFLETLRQDREEGIDFHRMNGTKFFGLKYEEVPQGLRDDACKRIIYGAQNNMGVGQLMRLMGDEAIDKAKKLLKLPAFYSRVQVAEILIGAYDVAYPEVRKNPDSLYQWIKTNVKSTKLLTSDLGWTRYCFEDPTKSKPALNMYSAHVPQALSVGVLNEGLKEGYWKVRVPNSKNIRLKAQIHDSILGQVRAGHEQLVMEFRAVLQRKVPIKDKNGITRMMEIPVAAKISPIGGSWGSCVKWKGEIEKLP